MPRPKPSQKSRRKPVNLSLTEDIVEQAKALKINVSQVAETALTDAVRQAKEAKWLEENADAVKEYNERVDSKGMYNDDLRRF